MTPQDAADKLYDLLDKQANGKVDKFAYKVFFDDVTRQIGMDIPDYSFDKMWNNIQGEEDLGMTKKEMVKHIAGIQKMMQEETLKE